MRAVFIIRAGSNPAPKARGISMSNIIKFPSLSEIDEQYIKLEKQRDLIEEQRKIIEKIKLRKKWLVFIL